MSSTAASPDTGSTTDTTRSTTASAGPAREFAARSVGGGAALLLGLAGLLLGAGLIVGGAIVTATAAKAVLITLGVLLIPASIFAMCGLNTVAPGEARVVQLFGRYRGPSGPTGCAGSTR